MAQPGKGKPSTVETAPKTRTTAFDRNFLEDLQYWVKTDRKIAMRLLELVEATARDPFSGKGKPEPLKHNKSGMWSRRLTEEHRLVYRVTAEQIDFMQGHYHY